MKKSKIGSILISCVSLLALVACGGGEKPTTKDEYDDETLASLPALRDTYTNDFQEDKIPGQWENYGVGDPFVYRYNGTYYLYVSTKDNFQGVRAWKSTDLINWEKCTGEGLKEGYVSEDDSTISAYAPEVMYKNGKFYMIQSPAGKGHIILTSDTPEGPFVRLSDSLDSSIDGSFFYKDEEVYMLKASNSGIKADALNDDMQSFNTTIGSKAFNNTSLGTWTEGPYMLNYDGKYYLSYTGVHVVSPGYRVSYSYSENSDWYNQDAFTFGDNVVLNTSNDYQGLGHSSTVLGPNLDSYYMAYHNLRSSGGPKRGFNVARIDFNGTQMSVNHPEKENNIVPEKAIFNDYDGSGFKDEGEFKLSSNATEAKFTAEYNVTGTGAKMVFSYVDAKNYSYATFDNNLIKVMNVKDSQEKEVTSYQLKKEYDYTKLHTLRVSYNSNSLDVHFDNMELINDFNVTLNAGKIGYNKLDSFSVGYTGFSNEAEGSSSSSDFKQDKVIAQSFDLDKSKLTEGSGLVKVTKETAQSPDHDSNSFVGANYMNLKTKGDRASYLTYFNKEQVMSVDIRVPKSMLGKNVGIKVNNDKTLTYKLDSYTADASDFLVKLGNIKVKEGANYISFINVGDEVSFLDASFMECSDLKTTYENDLSNYVEKGVTYVNAWKIKNGGHYALAGTRQLMYFGDETIKDVDVEVTLNFDGKTLTKTAGVIVAGNNAGFSIHDNASSIQGYYCSINNSDIVLTQSDYNKTIVGATSFVDDDSLDSNKDIVLKVSKTGKNIKFYINGKLHCDYTSSLGRTQGYVGLYTDGAGVTYKNLKIDVK